MRMRNVFLSFLLFCGCAYGGEQIWNTQIRMMPPPTDDKHVTTKEYVDAADSAEAMLREEADSDLEDRVDDVEETANNSVQYDAEGDVPLQAGTNIQVVIPQPNDPTTGDPVDPVERTLLDTDAAGNFIVGSPDSELNLQASVRPTTQVAGGAIEDNAFLSDLTDFATQSDLDAEIAYKADLVSGVVPDAQLPAHVKVNNWGPVAAEADLVTLTDATVNDRAFVGTENPYETYYLIAMPPTDSANWIQASGSGGDGTITSVNGDIGPVVNIDLPQLPGVQNALDDKANASDLATLAPLASPALTGTPTAPTPATTTNNTQVATAAFVNTRIASGNAATATTLQTARTIQTNLASTAAASFNGSANVAPGVTGVLPLANGGTGATTAANALTALGGTPAARTIATTAPLTGGGNLTANRTLAISPATAATATAAGAAGSVTYAADNDTTSRNRAVTPAGMAAAIGSGGSLSVPGSILQIFAEYANPVNIDEDDITFAPFFGTGVNISIPQNLVWPTIPQDGFLLVDFRATAYSAYTNIYTRILIDGKPTEFDFVDGVGDESTFFHTCIIPVKSGQTPRFQIAGDKSIYIGTAQRKQYPSGVASGGIILYGID